jgi:peroxiredoxin
MPEIGQEAPDFNLPNQHGQRVTLAQYRGEKNVVLTFYPWAFTSTCTGELCSIRDRIGDFDNDDTVTLAVSCDSKYSLRVFAEQEGYSFQLLADHWPHGALAQAYDVFVDAKGVAKRGTFIIDKQGILRWSVVTGIDDERDADEYFKVLEGLRSAV